MSRWRFPNIKVEVKRATRLPSTALSIPGLADLGGFGKLLYQVGVFWPRPSFALERELKEWKILFLYNSIFSFDVAARHVCRLVSLFRTGFSAILDDWERAIFLGRFGRVVLGLF